MYIDSCLPADANNGLEVIDFTSSTAPCTCPLLWDPNEYRRRWCSSLVLYNLIKSLDLFVSPGGSSNADGLQHLVFVIEYADQSTLPIANTCQPKGSHHISSHSSRQFQMAGDFVKYSPKLKENLLQIFFHHEEWGFRSSSLLLSLTQQGHHSHMRRCTSFPSSSKQMFSLVCQLDTLVWWQTIVAITL